jgi:hypothetical protein
VAQFNTPPKAQQEIGGKCYFYLHVPAAEAAAWANTVDRMAQCGAGYAEPPRDKMLGISECGAKAMNELIRPNMHSKKRFDDYMEARKSEHEEYRE